MHGRPREYKNKLKDPSAQASYKKKVDAIRAGTALVLACRAKRQYNEVVMDASAKLLKVVPEIYTIWNFRREALGSVIDAGGEAGKAAAQGELTLTQACLMENPKSYSTWHHRKWIVAKGGVDLDAELALVTRALSQDPRNFHAWNYRQFVVRLMGRPLEQELRYAEDMVASNFSNYSAWHYRTILLHRLHCSPAGAAAQTEAPGAYDGSLPSHPASTGQSAGSQLAQQAPSSAAAPDMVGGFTGTATQATPIPVEVLDEEYDMVHQAFATDSQDQSPWMYYRWLVGNSLAHLEAARGKEGEADAAAVLEGVLAREVGRMREDHLAEEPDARWPLLTLARLLEAQARLGLHGERSREEVESEVRDIYTRLMTLDPMRKGYYQDALEGKAFVVVSALGTV